MPFWLALLALGAGAACTSKAESPGKEGGKGGGKPPVPVLAARAETADVPVELRALGTVEAAQSSPVRSQVTGVVTELGLKEGDPVQAGQVLFRIDPRPLEAAFQQLQADLSREQSQARLAEAQVRSAEAQVRSAEARAKNAEAQARRYDELLLKDFVTREQVDQRRSDADAAAAAVDEARASLDAARAGADAAKASSASTRAAIENARVQLGYTVVRSPVTGRAGALLVRRGDLVKANDAALVTVNQIDPVLVRFTVPEQSLPDVQAYRRKGTLLVRVAPPGSAAPRRGRLVFLDNAVDRATGTLALKAEFPNSDGVLWPGQFVEVSLELTTRRGAVVVPSEAIQAGQEGPYVFVVGPDGAASMRPVTPGLAAGGRTVVDRGIEAGETVVTDGQLKLTPGTRVAAKESLGPAAAEEGASRREAGRAP